MKQKLTNIGETMERLENLCPDDAATMENSVVVS